MAWQHNRYYYLHEEIKLKYSVLSKPPPADSAEVIFHKQTADGAEAWRKTLEKQGSEIAIPPWTPKSKSIAIGDSPIWAEFIFKKAADAKPERKKRFAMSLAEAAPREIEAPKEIKLGDAESVTADVKITKWQALAHDRGAGGLTINKFEETNPGRIEASVKSGAKWQVDGADASGKTGENVSVDITKDHLRKTVVVEAYVGDSAPGDAQARIHVPELRIVNRKKETPAEEMFYKKPTRWEGILEPALAGPFAWEVDKPDHFRFEPKKRLLSLEVIKLTAEQNGTEVTVTCKKTSTATSNEYEAKHTFKIYLGEAFIEFVVTDDADAGAKDVEYVLIFPDGEMKKEGTLGADGKVREEKVPEGNYTLSLKVMGDASWGSEALELDKAVKLKANSGHPDDTEVKFEVFAANDLGGSALDSVTGKVASGKVSADWTPTEAKLKDMPGSAVAFVASVGTLTAVSPPAVVMAKHEVEVQDDGGSGLVTKLVVGSTGGHVVEATSTDGKAAPLIPLGEQLAWIQLPDQAGAIVSVEADGETREHLVPA